VCQTASNEPLVHHMLDGHESLINNLEKFAEHNASPTSVRHQQMNDGSGTLSTISKTVRNIISYVTTGMMTKN